MLDPVVSSLIHAAKPFMGPVQDSSVRVLSYLEGSGRRGASQRETAKAVDLAEATVSRICDQLEIDGLVRREPHPNDRRAKMMHLTGHGMMQLQLCCDDSRAGIAAALSEFTEAERALLDKMLHRLTSRAAPPRSPCAGCMVGGCQGKV